MQEIVPYQKKRQKKFADTISPEAAITDELIAFWNKQYAFTYPTEGAEPQNQGDTKTTLYTATYIKLPSLATFIHDIGLVTSPALIEEHKDWTLARLDRPVLLLCLLKQQSAETKKSIEMLPKPYQAMLRHIYTATETCAQLAVFLQSKKRAKHYLRILQKRLGIYRQKKPQFTSFKYGARA